MTNALADQLLAVQGFASIDRQIATGDDMHDWPVRKGTPLALAAAEYMRSGHEALVVVENALAALGRSLESEERVLEFAAGYGRLTRFLVQRMDPARLDVSDVLAPAVEFARRTFGVGGFVSRADPAELELDERYSLIYVGSLFSHLPRHRFVPMLRRLYEALTPDGVLLFSTHGTRFIGSDAGFVFRTESESEVLDLAEYGATFVAPEVVRELADEAGVRELVSLERELWWCQDLYAAAPKSHPGWADWRHADVARGKIAKVDVRPEEAHAWVGGYVRVPRAGAGVERVEVVLDGALRLDVLLATEETPMGPEEPREHFAQYDWYVEGSFAGLGPGEHGLLAVAHFTGGGHTVFDAVVL